MTEAPQLILIEWLDNRPSTGGWQRLADFNAQPAQTCVSVGFLIRDGQDAKVIAPNLSTGEPGSGWDHASSLLSIPTSAILKTRKIAPLVSMARDQPRPVAEASWLRKLA